MNKLLFVPQLFGNIMQWVAYLIQNIDKNRVPISLQNKVFPIQKNTIRNISLDPFMLLIMLANQTTFFTNQDNFLRLQYD